MDQGWMYDELTNLGYPCFAHHRGGTPILVTFGLRFLGRGFLHRLRHGAARRGATQIGLGGRGVNFGYSRVCAPYQLDPLQVGHRGFGCVQLPEAVILLLSGHGGNFCCQGCGLLLRGVGHRLFHTYTLG
jgi:hypothetical protein